jgi:hypothetical protein
MYIVDKDPTAAPSPRPCGLGSRAFAVFSRGHDGLGSTLQGLSLLGHFQGTVDQLPFGREINSLSRNIQAPPDLSS